MKITTRVRDRETPLNLPVASVNILQKIFAVLAAADAVMCGYIIYGLFSGQLAAAASTSNLAAQHALNVVLQLSSYINISLPFALIIAVILFWENSSAGAALLLAAAALSYGVNLALDYLSSNGTQLKAGMVAHATLSEMGDVAMMLAVAGGIILARSLWDRIRNSASGPDLTAMKYGANAREENNPRALLGAAAKCWQLPYCKEAVRKTCPIFHAKSKCWKHRVGCMCEENIMRLSMANPGTASPANQGIGSGFVAIGDLISTSESNTRSDLPTKVGPKGVRIPHNPNLSAAKKKERCNNCVIYNEHQRQKYNLFSPIVTLAVPLFAILNYSALQTWLANMLHNIDMVVGHLQFTGTPSTGPSVITQDLTGSIFIEGILIFCMGVIVLSFALRLVEYVVFTLKI
jgi:hypothetical protein